MVVILPSLASANTADLASAIRSLDGYGHLHFDIEDGNFVDNITFGLKTIRAVRKLTDAEFDAHLMVMEPLKYISPLAEQNFKTVAFHWESTGYPMRIINEIKRFGMRASAALNPITPADAIAGYLPVLDEVLIMSSEPDGCGELFQPHVIEKIRRIRKLSKDIPIVVDGGIGLELLPLIAEAGAVKAVMGRAVFNSINPKRFIESCTL